MTTPSRTLVIGLGNEYRSDDAVGHVVARSLMSSAGNEFRVKEESGEGGALMEAWKDADFVVLVDAVESGGLPGTIRRMDARARGIPSEIFHCSAMDSASPKELNWHARSSDFPLTSLYMALRERVSRWAKDSRRKWKQPRAKSFAA